MHKALKDFQAEYQQQWEADCEAAFQFQERRDRSEARTTYLIVQQGSVVTEHRRAALVENGKEWWHHTDTRRWDSANPKDLRRMPKRVLRQLQPV
jgi:hypothetical protein